MKRIILAALAAGILTGCGRAAPVAPPPEPGIGLVAFDGFSGQVLGNARRIYGHYDADFDGALTRAEAGALQLIGEDFSAVDYDGDALISLAEFTAPMRIIQLSIAFQLIAASVTEVADADGDQRVSEAEYLTGALEPRPGPLATGSDADMPTRSFAAADSDHDGFLTDEEVVGLVGYMLDAGYHLALKN